MKSRVNWNVLLNQQELLVQFAKGEASANKLEKTFRESQNTELAREFRGLVRPRGVQRARYVTKSALNRRGLLNNV